MFVLWCLCLCVFWCWSPPFTLFPNWHVLWLYNLTRISLLLLAQAVINLIQLIRFGSHHFLLYHSPVRSVSLHVRACGFFPLLLSFLALKKVCDQTSLNEQMLSFHTPLQYCLEEKVHWEEERTALLKHTLWMTTHIPLMEVPGWCALKDGSSFFAYSGLRLMVRLLSWTQYNTPTGPPQKNLFVLKVKGIGFITKYSSWFTNASSCVVVEMFVKQDI